MSSNVISPPGSANSGLPNSGLVVWFTGLSGSGKTTLSRALADRLQQLHVPVTLLDGDVIRKGLSSGLGFSREDRIENVRRITEHALQIMQGGNIVLIAAIAPYREAPPRRTRLHR